MEEARAPMGAHHAPVVVEQLRVDHLRVGELCLELDDASLDEALALARRLVLGVLGDVALRARIGDGCDHRRPVHRLQAMQLDAQLLGTCEGDRDLAHGARLAWRDWMS